MLRSTIARLKLRLASIAPRIFNTRSGLLQKLSATAFLKPTKDPALLKQEQCRKCQEIVDRCFAPPTPLKFNQNINHVMATDIPRDVKKAKEQIIAQIFSDDLTRRSGDVGKILNQTMPSKEELVTKIETIEGTELIEENSTFRESASSNVFGDRLSQYSVDTTVNDEFDEIARRCLYAERGEYDKTLLREVERIGVPPIGREYNKSDAVDKYDNPIDAIISDDQYKRSHRTGTPYEAMLLRDPTIFNEDKDKPSFRILPCTPMHLFQEPLIHAQVSTEMDPLQVTHHAAISLEPQMKSPLAESEIEESFFDDDPAFESDPVLPKEKLVISKTSSKFLDVTTFPLPEKAADTSSKEQITYKDIPDNVQASTIHYTCARPMVDPQAEPEIIQKPQTQTADPLPLNDKTLTLKQLLERIRERSKIEYSEKANASQSSYPGNCPCNPPTPFCPGGKPQCVPPCESPAPYCPPTPGKPFCRPPCEMPAGPCPQKKTCSKLEKPFFKDLVVLLIHVGVIERSKPKVSRFFSRFLMNLDICAFAMLNSDFMPSKVDDPEKIKGLLNTRDYEPWSPIPSWPIPKTEKRRPLVCPQEGCKLIPPPRLHPPCLENPCKDLPIPRTFHVPFSNSHFTV